ncbi:MAG: LLM class flavin-dependent oxidoreductase, partial [Acidimicrobiales bacterium]|nr:LLM class flavin-dependent oxidoreductase [Acidimicrobiales bacterium]
MKVRFAVAPGLPAFGGSDLAELVDGLEDLGFDTIWLSDIPLGPAVDPFAGLAFAAGRTTRLKLGANIVPFGRTPFVLAKTLAQLDRLSAGRLLLSFVPGIDQPGERSALGIEGEDRGALLDRIVPVLRTWWAGGSVDGIELRTP